MKSKKKRKLHEIGLDETEVIQTKKPRKKHPRFGFPLCESVDVIINGKSKRFNKNKLLQLRFFASKYSLRWTQNEERNSVELKHMNFELKHFETLIKHNFSISTYCDANDIEAMFFCADFFTEEIKHFDSFFQKLCIDHDINNIALLLSKWCNSTNIHLKQYMKQKNATQNIRLFNSDSSVAKINRNALCDALKKLSSITDINCDYFNILLAILLPPNGQNIDHCIRCHQNYDRYYAQSNECVIYHDVENFEGEAGCHQCGATLEYSAERECYKGSHTTNVSQLYMIYEWELDECTKCSQQNKESIKTQYEEQNAVKSTRNYSSSSSFSPIPPEYE